VTYVLSAVAWDDLLTIWTFSADRWDEDQADLYIDSMTLRFVWLAQNRGLWHERPGLGEGLCSYMQKSHVIIFREVKSRLHIIRVLHASMDPDLHVGH